jgi:dihydroorotate dehydrogenase
MKSSLTAIYYCWKALAFCQQQSALAINMKTFESEKKAGKQKMQFVDTFKASLDPSLFKVYRRYLYSRYKATDELAQAEVVHEKAKERLLKMTPKFIQNMSYFDPGEQLAVKIENHRLKSPVGIAAGFDKNCDVLRPTSYVFGFLNPGSVLRDPNAGNFQRPKSDGTVRIVVDERRKAIINAQGYPHKGLDYTTANLKKFSESSKGKAKILLNFSGITDVNTEDAVLDSCKEIIVRSAPYVDFGFEENRTSPNTDFNKVLQTPEFTKKIIDLMNTHVPGKVKVSKVSPYSKLPPSDDERKTKLKSIKVFYEGGGQMVTLCNTRSIDTKSTALSRNFARGVAGESGRPLLPYMLKLVEDVHKAFPDMTIIACGGIFSGEDAWKAYENGATLLSLYTALTFYGFGVIRGIHDVLKRKLGSETLQGFVEKRDDRLR